MDIISGYGDFTLYRKNSDEKFLKDQLQKNPKLTELNALLDEAEKREHTSRDEIIDNLFDSGKLRSKMHGAFMVALANLPLGINSAARSGTWSTRLQDVKDSAPQSWIAELIQNARDAGASEIEIEMFDDSLKFSHNGEDFKATELVALISISSTTKSGNVASIGQFGVGFKYWILHFENLEVRVNTENDKTLHSLSLKYDLTSTNSIYQTTRSTREGKRTEFIFTNPKDTDGWKDFVSPDIEEILGTRISNSLPMLQTDDRTLVVRLKQTKSDNEELREYSCQIKQKLASSYDDLSLERISYGLINENKEFIRARMSLSNIIKIHNTKIGSQYFLDLYREELMKNQTTQNFAKENKETIEETARNIAERALEETYVTILLTPEENEGAISRLFIAEQINNVTFAFIADAPWMLSDDRHNWASINNSNKNKEWNQFISRFVNKLYSLTVKEILADGANVGLNHSEMYEILNRPFGIDYFRDRGYERTMRFDYNLKINHLIDTLGQPSKKGFTEAFCFIWKGIMFNENARNWLEGAMDKNRISIELANGIICPIKNPEEEYRGEPEICHNYSSGFPNEIIELIKSCDGQVIEKEELLRTFDEVVRDNSGANKFWTEIDDAAAILVNQIEEGPLDVLKKITIPLEGILDKKVLYFVDDEKNLEGYERILTENEKDFSEIMEFLVRWIFELSREEKYNLDPILQHLIDEKPRDLSWGRALLKDWNNEPILIMLPPKNHNLAIVKGNDQEETILLSVDTKKLVDKKPKLQIDEKRMPCILYWKRENRTNDLTYVRSKSLPYVEIKDRTNSIDQWNFSPFICDSLLLPNKQYGWNWAEIEVESIVDAVDDIYDLNNRLNPFFIDGLFSNEISYSVHKGLREKDRYGDIEPIFREKKTRVHPKNVGMDDANDNTIPWQLLIASVNKKQTWGDDTDYESPSPLNNFCTEKGSPKPKFSNGEYYGGIIRIIGSFSMIMDRIKVNDLEDLLKKIHLISYYKQTMDDKQRKIADKAYAFDSMWVKGNSQELGIIGKYIPRSHVAQQSQYIGDDDEERTRKHEIFRTLDSENVSGFRETKLNYEPVNFNRKTFNHEKWLPRIDRTKPEDYTMGHFDMCWTNLICVKLHTEREIRDIFSNQQIDAGLRSGVERLIEVILDVNPNNSEEALEWLNELIKIGMPTRGWLGMRMPSSRISVKVSLREKIEEEGLEDRFEDLYNEVSTQNRVQWRDLEDAIRTGATVDRIRDDFGDVQIPTLQPGDIRWISDEDRGVKIRTLAVRAEKTKLIVKNNSENYPLNLFINGLDASVCVVKERSIFNKLKEIHDFEEITNEMYKVLKTNIDTSNNSTVRGNRSLEYITKMLSDLKSDLYDDIDVNWYDYGARNSSINTGFPFTSSEGCIAIDIKNENRELIINISDINIDGILDIQIHEWISKWLIDLLNEYGISKDDIILSIEKNRILSPWYWLIPDLGNQNGEEKDDFIRDYCPNLLTLRQLIDIPNRIEGVYQNNPDEAREKMYAYFEQLVDMYKDNDRKLENSHNGMEKEFYEDVPSIVTDWIYSNPSVNNTTSVDRKINIGWWMLEGKRSKASKIHIEAIGTILYVNYSEEIAFKSYISNPKRQERGHAYDFSDEFYDNLWEKIIKEGIENEEWFINQRGGVPETIIEIPEMFISNNRELKSGSLHKIHALHILAYLTALND